MDGITCVEPLLEDIETLLSCLNSSVDNIRFPGPIAQNDAQLRRFRDHGQGKRHVWQEQSQTLIVSYDPFAADDGNWSSMVVGVVWGTNAEALAPSCS